MDTEGGRGAEGSSSFGTGWGIGFFSSTPHKNLGQRRDFWVEQTVFYCYIEGEKLRPIEAYLTTPGRYKFIARLG